MSSQRLSTLQSALLSDNVDTRSRAVTDLLAWVQQDASIARDAWPIFWTIVRGGESAWQVAAYAARGIEAIGGPDAARDAWLELIDRPDRTFAAHVVLHMENPIYSADLIARLAQQTDLSIRGSIIQTLGHMKDPISFEPLVAQLATPQLRPAVVEALHRLGDPRAIPYIEPLMGDDSDAGVADERGYPLRLGDLAYSALSVLKRIRDSGW